MPGMRIKNEFIKNILTLLSGASIAQGISLLAIPVLTRIYSPEEFGFLALFISLAHIISTIATGRYELAIMLPEQDKDAKFIMAGAFRIVLSTSLVALAGIIFVKNAFPGLKEYIAPGYFYLLPLSILLLGSNKILTQWLNRKKAFKIQAKIKIFQSTGNSLVSISSGFSSMFKSAGLFAGHIAGTGIQTGGLLWATPNVKKLLFSSEKKQIRHQLKLNRNFPFFSAPMGVLNLLSSDLLIYLLNAFYTTSLVGIYNNANKVINYPLSLISQAFTSVFYQKIRETKRKEKLYLLSYLINFSIATTALIPIILWGEEIFSFVLGKEWALAGSIAGLLAPVTIASFAMRSVSNVFSLLRKNHTLLIWQCIYLALVLLTVLFTKADGFNQMLISFSLVGAILYIILAYTGWKLLKKAKNEKNN